MGLIMDVKCAYTELVPLDSIIANPKNANKHTPEQIERLAKIIDFQGMRSPLVVSKRSGLLTKGHCRLEALKLLKWENAPVDYQDYENEAQEYADMIADNEIARWATLEMESVHSNLHLLDDEGLSTELLGLESLLKKDMDKTKDSDSLKDEAFELRITLDSHVDMEDLYQELLLKGYMVIKI